MRFDLQNRANSREIHAFANYQFNDNRDRKRRFAKLLIKEKRKVIAFTMLREIVKLCRDRVGVS